MYWSLVPVVTLLVTSPRTLSELPAGGGDARGQAVYTGLPHAVRFVMATRSPARTSTAGSIFTV